MPVKNLLLIVCFLAYNTFAQTIPAVDSILNSVNVEDSSHIDEVVQALRYSKVLGYEKGEARAYHMLGYIYQVKRNFPASMEKYLMAEHLYKSIGDDEKRALVCTNIAYSYHSLKDYENAKKYSIQVLAISNNDSTRAYAHNAIGRAEMAQGNTRVALDNFSRAIKIMEDKGMNQMLYKFYTNLGISYYKNKQYDSAINTLWKIHRVAYHRKDVLAGMYMNIGVNYHMKKDFENAELNYLESISLGDRENSGQACLNYAELLHERGEKEKAKQYLAHGLTYNYDLGHLGRTLYALEMYKESSLVRDSLYMHATKDFEQLRNTSVNIATIESDLKNAREKAALKEVAEYKSKWMWAVAGISFLLLAMAGKYLYNYRSLLANVKLNNKKIGEYFTGLGQKI